MTLVIDKPFEEWDEEDRRYAARQYCPPIQAIGDYGCRVTYMGEDLNYCQIKEGEQVIADHIPVEQLRQKVGEVVKQKREEENVKRLKYIKLK